jgi:hypothetical protein
MKKLLLLISITVCLGIIIPCKTYATDITAGATTWFVQGTQTVEKPERHGAMDSDLGLLYGPTLSVKLSDDFNLTFVFLYGKLNYKDTHENGYPEFKSSRIDADLALNYRLNNYFKIFGGIKYLAFDLRSLECYGVYYDTQGKHKSFGPGLGLSFTYPMTENLFFLATLSGFYLTDFKIYSETVTDQTNPDNSFEKLGFADYGINSNLSIAYYIAQASTVISLGVRVHSFSTKYNRDEFPVTVSSFTAGITLSAAYTFSI